MKRRIALVALAVVLAAAGTVAVYAYVHRADQRALAGTRATQVLIADRTIPAGTSWSDAMSGGYLHTDHVPASTVPQNALTSATAPIGRREVAGADIAAGQILLRQMFADRQAATGALQIPSGDVAVSVAVPTSADVAGFVEARSEVAIFATYRLAKGVAKGHAPAASQATFGGQNDSVNLYATKLLLPRVSVLATSVAAPTDVSGASNASDVSSQTQSSVTVTLAVSQNDAERLILSQTVGQLYLALLSSDSVTAPDGGVINAASFSPAPVFVK